MVTQKPLVQYDAKQWTWVGATAATKTFAQSVAYANQKVGLMNDGNKSNENRNLRRIILLYRVLRAKRRQDHRR